MNTTPQRKRSRFIVLMTLIVCACNLTTPQATPLPATDIPPDTATPFSTKTPALDPTATFSPAETMTTTPEPTTTVTATLPPTPTSVPTYVILRGKVNVEKVSCRYGPGAMYLYLYGMVQGATQDVIGRNDDGSWALTQSRGDDKACWVKTSLMDLSGDILSVAPVHPDDYNLPKSPFYGPLTNVTAKRSGNNVTISWSPLILRAGDDSLQTPYVVQAWFCQSGQIVMQSLGAYDPLVTVVDEPGCVEPSHGRVTAAEKHGYTKFVEIPWPPAQ